MTKVIALFVVFQFCVVQQVCAAEIKTATVQYEDGTYSLTFEAILAAPQADVYRIITDYNRLNRLTDIINTSALLTRPGVSPAKRQIKLHVCILIYCRQGTLVETVTEYNMDTIFAVIIPEESVIDFGESYWQAIFLGKHSTQFSLTSQLRLGFWLPPVIGPWLIGKKMIRELSVMVDRLEQLAG